MTWSDVPGDDTKWCHKVMIQLIKQSDEKSDDTKNNTKWWHKVNTQSVDTKWAKKIKQSDDRR